MPLTLFGTIVFFNEAEAVASLTEDTEPEAPKARPKKSRGQREEKIKDLPVIPVEHRMTEEELTAEFGESGWYRLPDEVYRRYRYLFRNSLVSPSLEAAIINAKYTNAVPLYRQEQEFKRYGGRHLPQRNGALDDPECRKLSPSCMTVCTGNSMSTM